MILRVTGVTPPAPLLLPPQVSGSNILLSWTAISNLVYRVEFNPTLAPSNWSAVSGDVTSTGSVATKLDPLTATNRLYRVRVVP